MKKIYLVAIISAFVLMLFSGWAVQTTHAAANEVCVRTGSVNNDGTFDWVHLHSYRTNNINSGTGHNITLNGSGAGDQDEGGYDCYNFTANAEDRFFTLWITNNTNVPGYDDWYFTEFLIKYNNEEILYVGGRACMSAEDKTNCPDHYVLIERNDDPPPQYQQSSYSTYFQSTYSTSEPCTGVSSGLTLHELSNGTGRCLRLAFPSSGSVKYNLTNYPFGASDTWNDKLSALDYIPPSYTVFLYEHVQEDRNGGTKSRAFTGDESYVGAEYDEWASSVEIVKSSSYFQSTYASYDQASYSTESSYYNQGAYYDQASYYAESTYKYNNPTGFGGIAEALGAITFWLFVFAVPLLSLMILYGGFLIMTSGGAEERYGQGIKTIRWGVIGFIVILLAGAIAAIVRSILG